MKTKKFLHIADGFFAFGVILAFAHSSTEQPLSFACGLASIMSLAFAAACGVLHLRARSFQNRPLLYRN